MEHDASSARRGDWREIKECTCQLPSCWEPRLVLRAGRLPGTRSSRGVADACCGQAGACCERAAAGVCPGMATAGLRVRRCTKCSATSELPRLAAAVDATTCATPVVTGNAMKSRGVWCSCLGEWRGPLTGTMARGASAFTTASNSA